MTFADADLARLLVGLAVLLVAALGMGSLFARFGQPAAIGEIVGGVLLGPSLLAALSPTVQHWIFPASGPVGCGPRRGVSAQGCCSS